MKITEIITGTACLLAALAGCAKQESDFDVSGNVDVLAFAIDGYPGDIDLSANTITVALPQIYETDAMTVTALEVTEGAEASLKVGDVVDFSVPRSLRVTNANVFQDYEIVLSHDEAKILSFALGEYTGVINQDTKHITVRVPVGTDLTAMVPSITVNDGAAVSPESGVAQDFSAQVEYTVTYKTATSVYTVEVIESDAPTAIFVGLAGSYDQLGDEEKEAATWMLNNVPNSQYVPFSDINAGRVDLSEVVVVWWHYHIDGGIDNKTKFENAAPDAVTAVNKMKELLDAGTGFVLTRFATFYAPYLGVTADDACPNNCWGGTEETPETAGNAWDFFITGHESHPLYSGIATHDSDGKTGIYTFDTGYRTTNSTCQWALGKDWVVYSDAADWRTKHGGTDLGYGGDGAVVVWEYESDGTRGKVLCIGSGCYDWYAHGTDTSSDQYHGNVAALTENAIDYVSKQ